MPLKSYPQLFQLIEHNLFRCGVFAADAGHCVASLFLGNPIHCFTIIALVIALTTGLDALQLMISKIHNMSGGKNAQLAFYYQNLYSVLRILEALREGKLLSASVEQNIVNSKKEVDLVLQFSDQHYEYYEVKSGVWFTDNGSQIKDCLLALFRCHKNLNSGEKALFYVIINSLYMRGVTKFVTDIRIFKNNTRITSSFRNYCSSVWGVEQPEIAEFHDFIKLLSLNPDRDTDILKVLVLDEIEKIRDGIVINAEHALLKEDLLNRLINKIIYAIKDKDGVVDLQEFVNTILDWLVRNEVAYTTTPTGVKEVLKETRNRILPAVQEKFPSLTIEQTEATNISET